LSKIHAPRKSTETPQKAAAAAGRVFKFSLKGAPPVDAKMWAQLKAAARTHREGQDYPVMVEAPDA